MNIVFFDFDGTITSRDSFIDFIIYSCGYKKFITGILCTLPFLVMYKLKIIPNWKAKEKVITWFFGGWTDVRFNAAAITYSQERLTYIIRDTAKKAIESHKRNGDGIAVVSASPENWLQSWCSSNELNLIATKLEIKDGRITGKLSTPNCYGIEKVIRIKEKFNLSDYDTVYAYGDSRGDREMLSLADVKYYRWKQV